MASVQLQLRRDTTTNINAAVPQQGEPWFDTVLRRLVVGDGQTEGGLPVSGLYGANGSLFQPALLEGGIELLPTASTTYSSTIAIPANGMLFAVSYVIKQAIMGSTQFEIGVSGAPAKFGSGLGAGTGGVVMPVGPFVFANATNLLLTSTAGGNFTGGAIRFALAYLTFAAPTS
jgi:Major tropism determinant N-terminal domain